MRFVLVHRKIRFRFVLVHRKIRLPVPNLTILRFLDIDKKTKLHNHHLEISDRIKIFSRILIFAWLYFSFEVQIRCEQIFSFSLIVNTFRYNFLNLKIFCSGQLLFIIV